MATYSPDHMVIVLQNTRTFKTNMHKLANATRMTDADATQTLTREWLLNRYPNDCFINEVEDRLTANDPVLMWSITYARLDIQRDYFTEQKKLQHEDIDRAEQLTVDNMADRAYLPDVLDVADKVFSHERARRFVKLALTKGKEGTMQELSITPSQFNERVRGAEKYCRNHKDKLIGVIKNKEDDATIERLRALTMLVDILEDETLSDVGVEMQVTNYLRRRREDAVISKLIGSNGITHQQQLIEDFGSNKREGYIFVDELYKERDRLQRRLAEG